MLLVKLHSRCNLDCDYCYMYHRGDESYLDQPKRMPWAVVERIPEMVAAECARRSLDGFRMCFHGGEPLLVGKPFFVRMMEHLRSSLRGHRMTYTLQTNAVLVDDEWVDIFARYDVGVGVSLDGPVGANGGHRLTLRGRDSTPAALRGVRRLQKRPGLLGGALCVVHPEVDGRELIRFFADEVGVTHFDLMLPDHSHDNLPRDWPARQRRLLRVVVDAFDEWSTVAQQGVRSSFFESIILLLCGQPSLSEAIGFTGVDVTVLETDGSLQAHDVLRVCSGLDRAPGIAVGAGAIEALRATAAFQAGLPDAQPLAPECQRCDAVRVCRGGYLPWRHSRANGFQNRSVHCEVLYGLIAHVRQRLLEAPRPRVVEEAMAAAGH